MRVHPSTAQARVVVDELVRCGVRHLVACPGSRNAALAIAAHDAAARGRLTLHVRIDERSAGFLALGLAKAGGLAAVFCTSGTAAANLHPAVLEARHSGTSLLVLTADRPAELHGAGANQTIDQHALYGGAAPCVEFPSDAGNAVWRATVCRAVALAADGPVQVNIPFREPLVPGGDGGSPAGRTDGGPWTRWTAPTPSGPAATGLVARTVLVVGDPVGRPAEITAAARAAATAGWPVIAEPTGRAAALAGGATVLANGSVLVNSGAPPPKPDEVLVAGRPTLSRGVGALLRSANRVRVLGHGPDWTDPQRLAAEVIDHIADVPGKDTAWLADWRAADATAGAVVDRVLAAEPWPSGAHVARDLVAALPAGATLFLGSSNPVRFVDLFGRNGNQRIMANRGVAGIDGSVSTAAGIALGSGMPCYALLGDLTFLHDTNGLLIGPSEPRPDLTVVVLNDDGGGIFTLLEQGAPEHAASFERMFGTPHGTDLAALCAAHHVPHLLVSDRDELSAALAPTPGLRVIEVRVDRDGLRDRQARLFHAVADALAG
ncbi:MAG TPA: 2-succinyl-5-enolpyruvyl-6-hydroxy-3-cyclohexene-1-carboxylic-acid synthase [Pseudonocardiaceae bacterium]|jgi:2-succinyl-5-enolpyruvyl-6-hydroxy-3-cyclohexene-1-carboxylate synthase|nr:2-succinyl-5-enolpyruvyl-6-hydroxy-3-cyclohexene-1-carboxylic-acid synthase [Pseudonocardiaceae bacterium]